MQAPLLNKYSKILVIRINHSDAGFFAYLNFALNQILYCEEKNLIPVVYFGPHSSDGPNAYFEASQGDNMWDYYFEPVAGYTYADIQRFISDPTHPLTEQNLIYPDDDLLSYLHAGNPDSIYSYPYGYYTELEEDVEQWYNNQRAKAQRLIRKYIRIKPHLLNEVDAFVERYFNNRPVLGIHIRGRDKDCASEAYHIMRIIPPEKYFPLIDEYIRSHPDCLVFLATDQSQFVATLKARYQERIITQSTILSDSNINAFQKQDGNGYQKGKEVLLDCLLLSHCNKLLKCSSEEGEWAHYFNSELTSVDQGEYFGPLTSLQKCYRALLVEPYIFFKEFSKQAFVSRTPLRQLMLSLLTDFPIIRRISNGLEAKQFSGNTILRTIFFLKKYISLYRHREEIPLQQAIAMAKHARQRIGSSYYSFRRAKGKKYLEIRCDGDPQAAFFAQYLYVLQQLRFAENNNLIPVVNFDHSYNYYYDKNYNKNVWENYFKPVSKVPSAELEKISPETITFLSREHQRQLFIGDGDEPPVKYNDDTKSWWQRQRAMGARLTAKYVTVRPHIQSDVELYYQQHMSEECVLGIHLRGTDKSTRYDGKPFEGPSAFTRIIPPEEYYPFIDLFILCNPDGKLFVASDQQQFLTKIVERYGTRVLQTKATRSSSNRAVFKRSGKGYQSGIEVLTDALLLSKCDYLLKCFSNVGEVATYFNPGLPVLDLFYQHKPEDYKRFFNPPKPAP